MSSFEEADAVSRQLWRQKEREWRRVAGARLLRRFGAHPAAKSFQAMQRAWLQYRRLQHTMHSSATSRRALDRLDDIRQGLFLLMHWKQRQQMAAVVQWLAKKRDDEWEPRPKWSLAIGEDQVSSPSSHQAKNRNAQVRRVYFPSGQHTTVRNQPETTAEDVCAVLAWRTAQEATDEASSNAIGTGALYVTHPTALQMWRRVGNHERFGLMLCCRPSCDLAICISI